MTVRFALPSKGRLRDLAFSLLERIGYRLSLPADQRSYRASILHQDEIELIFLPALEIAHRLIRGTIDLGITGEDLLYENFIHADRIIKRKYKLGFGHADLIVAVPEFWYDVTNMADLEEVAAEFLLHHGRHLRIATKYWHLTSQFFSQQHSIQLYRIVESLGATEAAPNTGSADLIVDITTSGATLAANKLKILQDGIILRSQACLFLSKNCPSTAAITQLEHKISPLFATTK